MFALKEADFATPASFAVVRNNTTQMMPDEKVTHPVLGIAGVRKRGSQPLCRILTQSAVPGPYNFFSGAISAIRTANTIWLNPQLLGGPLSVESFLYDRFVIRALRVKFTTYQPTTTLGVIALCIENDPISLSANDFDTTRMVTPNVTFPIRIPKAELDYVYEGPDLFYCSDPAAGVNVALNRQQVQGVLEGYDASPPNPGVLAGYLDIEYEVEFYDPIAPTALIGATTEERRALAYVRSMFGSSVKSHPIQKPDPPSIDDVLLLKKMSDEAKEP